MASLKDQFQRFYAPDPEAVALAIKTGLISLDTNVLLSAYRFQPLARDELFSVLENVGDRLWIPHQVALEFHQNRLNVIADQERVFGKTKDGLEEALAEYVSRLRAFSNRIALPQLTKERLEGAMRAAHASVLDEVLRAEQANEVSLKSRDSDAVLTRLETLFTNRVGESMSPEMLVEVRRDFQKRMDAKIPPGYMDKGKADPAGDYIIWKQLMLEAATRKRPTVLITDDRKEDWFRREHGLTLGPRIELCGEMMSQAGVPFLIMTTETFLIQAKEYLDISVSSTTVDQAKEISVYLLSEEWRRHREALDVFDLRMEVVKSKLSEARGKLSGFRAITESMQTVGGVEPSREVLDALSEAEELVSKLELEEQMALESISLARSEIARIEESAGMPDRGAARLSGVTPLGGVTGLSTRTRSRGTGNS